MPSRFEADYSDPELNFDPLINDVFSELMNPLIS